MFSSSHHWKNILLSKSAFGAMLRQVWGVGILQTERVCGREKDLK